MPVLELKIGRQYHSLACGDGEEEKLQNLARNFNKKLQAIIVSNPMASDARILAMASLMLEDENNNLRQQLEQSKQILASAKFSSTQTNQENQSNNIEASQNEYNPEKSDNSNDYQDEINLAIAEELEAVSERLEGLVKKYKKV